jgi:uncharacterized protein YndB with AHSA1/START domain
VSERTVKHDTIVVERSFKSSRKRVFDAWADPRGHGLWKVPNEQWEIGEFENDFRVGGRERSCFGPPGDARYCNEGMYLDIVPESRIVAAGTMHDAGERMSVTLLTIELFDEGSGTRLILTDQAAFFDGRETPSDRSAGWGEILHRLKNQMDTEDAAN